MKKNKDSRFTKALALEYEKMMTPYHMADVKRVQKQLFDRIRKNRVVKNIV